MAGPGAAQEGDGNEDCGGNASSLSQDGIIGQLCRAVTPEVKEESRQPHTGSGSRGAVAISPSSLVHDRES